jgi:hypothetical protein
MRRFGLAGVVFVLWASSVSAQTVYNVTTTSHCCEKITVIEKVGPGAPKVPAVPGRSLTLDQLAPLAHLGLPMRQLACMLPDQQALLCRLVILDRVMAGALDDKKPIVEEKKADEKKDPKAPVPAAMITLDTREWGDGRYFTDDSGRRWCLVKGCPLPEKLPKMRGWLLESDGKKLYSLHETGNLYRQMVP